MKPSSAATLAASRPSEDPASAPAPSGQTAARTSQSRSRLDVPGQRLRVRQQLMPEQHRLSVLQVRHPRRLGARVPPCLVDQGGLQLGDPACDQPRPVAQVQPQVGGHLVVAAAAGAQLPAERPEPLEQPALQRGVHILVGGRRPEAAVPAGRVQVVEGGQHPVQFFIGQQAGPVQHPGVRARGEQVVRCQPPVELDAHREPGERFGRA